MEQFGTAAFWVALGKIIWVNVLLSGDNAVVIALAARGLPTHQRGKAIFAGSGAALLDYVAGEMIVSDRATEAFFQDAGRSARIAIEVTGAAGVVFVGEWLARRKQRNQAQEGATPLES